MSALWLEQAWQKAASRLDRTHERIGASYPHSTFDGLYDDRDPECWTNGFWPGILWHLYRETGEEKYRATAEQVEKMLDKPLHEYEKLHHDNGFLWSLSAVASYKTTGNPMSRRRGLIAASHLASRFNVKGPFIRAWVDQDSEGKAIIDCMMNLGLLYWASGETKDPRYTHLALAHADMALQHFVRPDGSVHHIVRFDPSTGERVEALGGQGYSPDSAWSRGTAWAIYGFALTYRYTKQARFLFAAMAVADFFMKHLPEDLVPPWDFRAPKETIGIKDSSAAAIAASGMLEIANSLGESSEGTEYLGDAERILRSLYENYTPDNPDEEGLLLKATGSVPHNAEIEVPIIYGDYFYVEALLKLKGHKELYW
ncbi:glycoside hydrolase family 88 protein [Paenibacillus lupini]|uniref:glycoside hydrolase family 88 protein n=1 Tax=Paenibacillus lupini TaxID=1450204 RepID=UPI00141EE4F3|nr:glycoside hydrolase family 88 protein [Paenibacillus lupini]NIK23613.1 unsaturated chondroitin disaccharide hydrolase [Paenibacillus lupini]